MCLVWSDTCVIVGFNITPQKQTSKLVLADRKELLRDVLRVQNADFTSKWLE